MSVTHQQSQHIDPFRFAGNWSRRPGFTWSDVQRPDDAEAFGLYVLRHRDSGLIDQSNAAAIVVALAPFEAAGDVVRLTCGHFGYGWTEEVAVRVFGTDEAAATTPAFDALDALVGRLAAYPILDEDDHAARSLDAARESIRLALIGSDVDPDALPDGGSRGSSAGSHDTPRNGSKTATTAARPPTMRPSSKPSPPCP